MKAGGFLFYPGDGAADWNRTNDLVLTKDALYRLSYGSAFIRITVASPLRWAAMCHSNPRTASKKIPDLSIFSAYLTCKCKKASNPAVSAPGTMQHDQHDPQEG